MLEIATLARPSIYEYDNYRAFLKDMYDYQKAKTTYFSFRYFARKAGYASPNFLKLVIDGGELFDLSSAEVAHRCLSSIEDLACNSPEASSAFDPNGETPYAGTVELLKEPCHDLLIRESPTDADFPSTLRGI